MESLKWQDCLNALNDEDQNWVNKVIKDKRIDNNKLGEKFVEFLAAIKAVSKMNNELPAEVRDELKSEKGLLDWLEEWVASALQGYKGFEPIRTLAADDDETVRNFLRAAFDNYVLRFDPQFVEKYCTYRLSRDEMTRVLQLLDSITDFYIASHMTRIAIREDFEEETGLNDELCDFYASLVDENYELLLMNYIAENLANMQKKEPTAVS